MIIVDNIKGMKKIKYDLLTMDLSVIDNMVQGDRVFGFKVKGEEYIGKIKIHMDYAESLVMDVVNGRVGKPRGRGQVIAGLSYTPHTANIELIKLFISKMPEDMMEELGNVTFFDGDSYREESEDKNKQIESIKRHMEEKVGEILGIMGKYGYSVNDIIRIFIEPLSEDARLEAEAEILKCSTRINTICTEIAHHRRRLREDAERRAKAIKDKFLNDLDPQYQIDQVKEKWKFSAYAYKVYPNGDVGKRMWHFDIDYNFQEVETTIWHYPEVRALDASRNEGYFSNISCDDYIYGFDWGHRDAPSAIVGDTYIIGKGQSEHEYRDGMECVRNSSIHSGLVFSYLIQRPAPLVNTGYKRKVIDDLINDMEDIPIAYGELVNNIHTINCRNDDRMFGNVSDEEVLKKAKEIMQVDTTINIIFFQYVLRCNAKGEQERYVELVIREE